MKWRAILSAVVLAAVSLPVISADQTKITADIATGTQIGVGSCVTTDPPSGRGLVDTVLTALVSKGINLLGNALTEAGKDKTWKSLGARNLPGGSQPFPMCLQVVRGRFRTDATAGDGTWLDAFRTGAYAKLNANGVYPADQPDFFFEGAIVTSEDKTAATVRPLLAVMYKPQGGRMTGGKERGVAVFLALSPAGTNANLETNPAATVVLGPMKPGQVMRFPAQLSGKQSTPYEASWFTLSEADARKPLTLTSLVTETQSGSPFFAFLASIFNDESVKKALTDKATVILVPSARDQAEATQTSQQRTAADKADTALADAITKLNACYAAAPDLTKAAEAKASLRAYLAADAELPSPLKKIDDNAVSSIDLTASDFIKQRCSDVHQRLTGKPL